MFEILTTWKNRNFLFFSCTFCEHLTHCVLETKLLPIMEVHFALLQKSTSGVTRVQQLKLPLKRLLLHNSNCCEIHYIVSQKTICLYFFIIMQLTKNIFRDCYFFLKSLFINICFLHVKTPWAKIGKKCHLEKLHCLLKKFK